MKKYQHLSGFDQPVKIGDRGGDEYDSLVCVGYHVNVRPSPGYPYVSHGCWYVGHLNKWYMAHPTDDKESIEVPESLEIRPTFEAPTNTFEFSIVPGQPGYSSSDYV